MARDNKAQFNAAEFDNNVRKVLPFYDNFHDETIDLVMTYKSDASMWLDTGCGTGTLTAKAAGRLPDTFFIHADPSESMLNLAKRRMYNVRAKDIRFTEYRLQTFKAKHDRFIKSGSENLKMHVKEKPDVITSIMSHHYFEPDQRQSIVQICYDLLADNGIYISFEHVRPESEIGWHIAAKRWKNFQASNGRSASTINEHFNRFGKSILPITVNEHLELLKKCGFKVVELFWRSQLQAGFYAIK